MNTTRRTVRREALLEALLRLPAQLPGLVERVASIQGVLSARVV